MFARPHSDHSMRGMDCLRTAAEKSEVAHPERLRSTKLRTHGYFEPGVEYEVTQTHGYFERGVEYEEE